MTVSAHRSGKRVGLPSQLIDIDRRQVESFAYLPWREHGNRRSNLFFLLTDNSLKSLVHRQKRIKLRFLCRPQVKGIIDMGIAHKLPDVLKSRLRNPSHERQLFSLGQSVMAIGRIDDDRSVDRTLYRHHFHALKQIETQIPRVRPFLPDSRFDSNDLKKRKFVCFAAVQAAAKYGICSRRKFSYSLAGNGILRASGIVPQDVTWGTMTVLCVTAFRSMFLSMRIFTVNILVGRSSSGHSVSELP